MLKSATIELDIHLMRKSVGLKCIIFIRQAEQKRVNDYDSDMETLRKLHKLYIKILKLADLH